MVCAQYYGSTLRLRVASSTAKPQPDTPFQRWERDLPNQEADAQLSSVSYSTVDAKARRSLRPGTAGPTATPTSKVWAARRCRGMAAACTPDGFDKYNYAPPTTKTGRQGVACCASLVACVEERPLDYPGYGQRGMSKVVVCRASADMCPSVEPGEETPSPTPEVTTPTLEPLAPAPEVPAPTP